MNLLFVSVPFRIVSETYLNECWFVDGYFLFPLFLSPHPKNVTYISTLLWRFSPLHKQTFREIFETTCKLVFVIREKNKIRVQYSHAVRSLLPLQTTDSDKFPITRGSHEKSPSVSPFPWIWNRGVFERKKGREPFYYSYYHIVRRDLYRIVSHGLIFTFSFCHFFFFI